MTHLERIHLEIIHAVDAHGSMTAAAEALHLTQSALSHSMRKLEDQLNVKLWHREGRQLIPTQAGQYLLNTAGRLLPQFLHTEGRLKQFADGERGTLRIGMECHPCYQWLHKITTPYLRDWPLIDLDVKQAFQFGAVGALFSHEIDLLVTPDPYHKKGLLFESVFDYEQVLVVAADHRLADSAYVIPRQLGNELLFTYPVSEDRLDIYKHFLTPSGRTVRRQKVVETTDIMLQMVACGRGVAALPRWLVEEYAEQYPIKPVRLGKKGLAKQIFLGIREDDVEVDFLQAFMERARSPVL
ncbi:MAG: LysR family transcriptional regulator [Coraliomargarita sp.]|nr:LysR family transcriptional regulator [Coraliomargarita sp.]